MNISSAVVRCAIFNIESVIQNISTIHECEVHMHEQEKIIITIEADNLNNELAIIKKIEQIKGVLSVEMVYAFSEDELDIERDKLEIAQDIPNVLLDETLDASKIPYGGDLKKKL